MVPRQQRPPPRRITRFNYWLYPCSYPESATRPMPTTLRQVEDDARGESRARFRKHCRGPCEQPACTADAEIERTSKTKRPAIALRYYVESDSLWQQDPKAQSVLSTLTPAERARFLRRDAAKWRGHRHQWDALLDKIGRDQALFRQLQDQVRDRQLTPDQIRDRTTPFVVDGLRVSPANAYKVYSAYRRQGDLLMGRGVRVPPEFIAAINRLRGTARGGAQVVDVMRPDGLRVRTLQPGAPVRPPLRPQDRVLAGAERQVCRDWDEVYAWFARALQNLKRFRSGHSPLRWSPRRPA